MKDGENKILHPKSVDSLRVKRGGEGLKDNDAQHRRDIRARGGKC